MPTNLTVKEGDATITAKPDEHQIVVAQNGSEETYSLDNTPPVKSQLVLNSKQEILQHLDLKTVLSNLNNSAGLMYVAYNALAGTQIQSKMSGLQKSLLDLCQDCIVAVQDFDSKSGDILRYIVRTYKYLLEGKEQIALKQLEHCGERAGAMAKKSEELAQGFNTIASTTEKVLEDSQNAENLQEEEIQKLQKQLRTIKADEAKTKTLQTQLGNSITQMQQAYEEAKSEVATESSRAFTLGIVSAVVSGIGSGVAAFAAVKNPMATVARGASSSQSSESTTSSSNGDKSSDSSKVAEEKAAADKAKKELEKTQAELKQAKATAEASQKKADQAKTTAEEAESGDKSAEVAAQKAQQEADAKKKIAEDLQKKAESQKAIADGLAAALADLSKSTSKMQEQSMTALQAAQQEKVNCFNQLIDLQKQNREALADLAKYGQQIKNTNIDTNIAANAVSTLHIAVRCLKQIVTSLTTAALFWRSMEQFCQRLSQSDLTQQIQDFEDLDLKDRLEQYTDPDFMYTAVMCMARWVALNSVCKDYLDAVNETYRKVATNIDSAPTKEEAWKLAPILASQMIESAEKQIVDLDASTKKLEAQKAAISDS